MSASEVLGIAGRDITITGLNGERVWARITSTCTTPDGALELECEPLPDQAEDLAPPVPDDADHMALVRYAREVRTDLVNFVAKITYSLERGEDLWTLADRIYAERCDVKRLQGDLEHMKQCREEEALKIQALWDALTDNRSQGRWADLEAARDQRRVEQVELERLRELGGATLAEVDRDAAYHAWQTGIDDYDLADDDARASAAGLAGVFFHLFGAKDGDGAFESRVFDQMIRVAELVHGLPCGCVESGGEEVQVCGRCRALARVKDIPMA